MAFRKEKSTQKCIFLRKHALTVENHYDNDIKIIEEECDIESAYPSRIQSCTNNKLLEISVNFNKFIYIFINIYKF